MKTKPRPGPIGQRLLLAAALALAAAGQTTMKAQPNDGGNGREQPGNPAMIGRLTRYAVTAEAREKWQQALSAYVFRALTEDGNIQAEAFHERDNRSVLWLIERWKSRDELERFGRSPQGEALAALRAGSLQGDAEVHYVTDLAPLTKAQWRQPAAAEDRPLTVMLFVDAKKGTENEFKATYQVALPAFRGESGVLVYQLSQLANDTQKFVTFEKFRSDAAFDYHLKFPPIQPVIDYLNTSIKRPPFQDGLHLLVEFAPLAREAGTAR